MGNKLFHKYVIKWLVCLSSILHSLFAIQLNFFVSKGQVIFYFEICREQTITSSH